MQESHIRSWRSSCATWPSHTPPCSKQDPSAPELSADDGETDQIISKLLGSDRDPAPLPAEGVPQVRHSLVCLFLVCRDRGFPCVIYICSE